MARNVEIPNGELTSFDLPRVCVATGATDGVVFKPVKFSWYPRWIVILAPFTLLIAAILVAILTKRSKGELPFTEQAYRAWRRGQLLFALSIFVAVGMLIATPIAFSERAEVVGWLLLVGTFALPITIGVTLARGRGPVAIKITDTHTTLKLPNDAAAAALQAHLVGGAPKPLAVPVLPPLRPTA